MKTCTATLRSVSPYSSSRPHVTEKLEKETPADFEKRTWREKLHVNDEGVVFIPGMSFKMALDKAAAVTPYSVRQIEDFLDPVCSSYDENFAKMVREAELIISSRSRSALVALQDDSQWADFETSKISQSKAWFHFKMTERLEPSKFGRRQVEVTGKIDHTHNHRYLPREERIGMLDDDRKRFIASRTVRKEIPPGDEPDSVEVIDAELVRDGA